MLVAVDTSFAPNQFAANCGGTDAIALCVTAARNCAKSAGEKRSETAPKHVRKLFSYLAAR